MNPTGAMALPLGVEIRGDGPPLVFLHGFGASSFTWRLWVPRLTDRYTAVLVDMKGFGSAPRPADGRYGPEDHADLVARLIVERDLRNVTLVGHSLGGGVAILTTLLLRDRGEGSRVRRLVAVASAAYRQPLPFYVSMARRRILARALLFALPTTWLIRTVLKSIVHDPGTVTDEQVRGYAEPLRDAGSRRALVETALQIFPDDLDRLVSRYGELELPALLLWGSNDTVVPARIGQRLAGDLPASRLVSLPECGHIPPEEKPGESLEAVERFLDETADALEAPDGR